jgi:cobalt/nickel transport system permease protein
VGAVVFAAQAINVPVLPFASGHLVGGVLAAGLLGPAAGALVVAAVLAIQAVALGDGGMLALGANVLNMALLPAGLVALANRWAFTNQSNVLASRRIPAMGLVAMLSVAVAAGLVVAEIAFARGGATMSELPGFASRMLVYHLWIGAGEAVITMAVLAAIMRPVTSVTPLARKRLAYAAIAASLIALLALAPLASGLPDGYEAAAERSEMAWLLQ